MNSTYLPDQYVSEKEKQKESWWKPTVDYWIAQAVGLNDKTEVQRNLDYANGIIDKTTFEYVLNPLVPSINVKDLMKKLPGELRDVDIITYVREKYQGEYMNLPYKFFVKSNNPETVLEFNHGLRKQVRKAIQQNLINMMNKDGQLDTNMQTTEDINVEEMVKTKTQEFFDNEAKKANDRLELINDRSDFETMRHQAYFYWFSTEMFYDYRFVDDNGKFQKELVSPDEGFPIDNGEQFVDDYDGFLLRRKISWQQFLDKYQNKLSKEELDYVNSTIKRTEHLGTPAIMAPEAALLNRIMISYGSKYTDNLPSDSYVTDTNQEIYENIIQFRVPRKIGILKYQDLDGEIFEMEVEPNYKLDKENGDISINIEYIFETQTAVRIGNQHTGVYIQPERDMIQRVGFDGKLKLHFTGKKGLMQEIKINPIPKRLSSYQALDRIILLHQERAMAKMKDAIMTIPKSMLYDKEKEAQEQFFYIMADGTMIYDDTDITADEVSKAFQIHGHPAADKYLRTLIDLRMQNRAEALDAANMNQERAGQSDPRGGKAITEQNIFRAKISSTLSIQMFHKALERSHQADLDICKLAWITGEQGSYFDKKNNRIVDVNVDGLENYNTQYGVFVVNSKAEEERVNLYKQIAFSAAQNAQFNVAGEAIEIDNAPEGRIVLNKLQKASEEFQAYMKQLESQGNMAVEQQREATREKDRELERELAYIKEEGDNYRARLKYLEGVVSSNEGSAFTDADRDSAKRELELLKLNQKDREMQQKERLSEKDRQLKREELKANKQIARMNKN